MSVNNLTKDVDQDSIQRLFGSLDIADQNYLRCFEEIERLKGVIVGLKDELSAKGSSSE